MRTTAGTVVVACAFFTCALILLASIVPLVEGSAYLNIPPKEERMIEPGESKTWRYNVGGAESVKVNLEGAYLDHATLEDNDPDGGARTVSVTWDLSNVDIEPGTHLLFIRATEQDLTSGMVGGRASVRTPMYVTEFADYPFIKAGISAKNQEKGEPGEFTISLESVSRVTVNNIMVTYTIYERDEPYEGLAGLRAALGSLESLEKKSVPVTMPTERLYPGEYVVKATITYDGGEPIMLERNFRVGVLSLNLIESPEKLYRGKINKVHFTVENEWNQPLKDVRGTVQMNALGIDEAAPSIDIAQFSKETMTFYLEPPEDAELGEAAGNLRVTNGKKGQTFTLPFTTDIVAAEDDSAPAQVVEERPEETSQFSIMLNPLVGAYLLVFILIIINIILLYRRKDGKR